MAQNLKLQPEAVVCYSNSRFLYACIVAAVGVAIGAAAADVAAEAAAAMVEGAVELCIVQCNTTSARNAGEHTPAKAHRKRTYPLASRLGLQRENSSISATLRNRLIYQST